MAEAKRGILRKIGKVLLIILVVILILIMLCTVVSVIGHNANMKTAKGLESAAVETQAPEIDAETGYWTFTTDAPFRILQLTDIHIGAGFLSIKKDSWAVAAVAELVQRTKPDLVVITGDIAYPVPFQSGTVNNRREANLFITTMESLGVYWTVSFGNHDTEVYSMYDRDYIANFYDTVDSKYLLFTRGPKDVDGEGNQIINIKNSQGLITQSIYLLDSHAYVDGSLTYGYDSIHQNQIEWYKNESLRMNAINAAKGGGDVKSLMFYHIPPEEFSDAWEEYRANGKKDTENVQFVYGIAGEPGEKVYCGKYGDDMFETILELGTTQGMFCGHDHLNNFSVFYKGVRLTYGLSIDYLAYIGIYKKTEQRGGTIITVSPDGSFDCYAELLVK